VIDLILLDLAPDPVVSIGALIALGILIVGVVTVLVVAFVFVLSWRKRRNAQAASAQGASAQPSSPNQ
jgi:predicted negative regulator of RcsB-dependent stress response